MNDAGAGIVEESGEPALVSTSPQRAGRGWIIQRRGALYADDFGCDASFEALVAEIAVGFLIGPRRTPPACCLSSSVGDGEGMAELRLLPVV